MGYRLQPLDFMEFFAKQQSSMTTNSVIIYIYIYIYIYIVIHRQTVSFYQNSSLWLEILDGRSRDRNPSNFTSD